MATKNHLDESLVERNEVSCPNTDMIDTEPLYKNFTTIQNFLRHSNTEFNTSIHSINDPHQLNHIQLKPYSNKLTDQDSIDGYIFNLIRIVEDIGYNPKSPFIRSSENQNGLSNLILKLGGTDGPLVKIRRAHIDKQYFQRWYLEKYPRSASMIQCRFLIKRTTQKSDDHQSNIYNPPSLITNFIFKQMDDKLFQNQVLRTYGFDDVGSISSISSRRSSIDEEHSILTEQSTPVVLETIDNFKPKQQITIREYFPSKDIPSLMASRSLSSSSSQQAIEDNDYEQFFHNHPELYHDPNPEVIIQPNPEQVTYKQNVSVRYLVPPTPPPPGPLIIREIIPPRLPTPPPFVIQQQDPSPPTPPPLILREVPPTPPPHQEVQIINKILPQEPPPSQRVIIEHNPPLPPKPQSIIIEKWLPYKPAPPREIIYERVTETPLISEFQPGGIINEHQRRHLADFHSQASARLPIPVHIERQNSFDHLATEQSSVFEQFAWSTQQQLETILAHQQWIANQHQQHMNLFRQMPLQLTTPALIVNHPPVTKIATSYAQREEILYGPTFMYPAFI